MNVARRSRSRDTGRSRQASLVRLRRASWAVLASSLLAAPAVAAGGEIVLAPDWKAIPMIIFFVLLVFPVNAFLLRPILAALDARAEKIEGTRGRAKKLEAEASEMLERYERSVAEVRASAELERREVVTEARAEFQREAREARSAVEVEIEQARQQVTSEFEQAREVMQSEARELAREAASRVLGRPLS